MIKRNKKGLSQVVTTTLLILLSLIAFTILAGIVMKLLKSPKLAPQISCAEWELNPPLSIQLACYNNLTGDLEVSIYRGQDTWTFDALGFEVKTSNDVHQWQCGELCGGCKVQGFNSMKTYFFNASGIGQAQQISLKTWGCEFEAHSVALCSR